MPNWVENNVEIYGNTDVLNKILNDIKSDYGQFDFDKIVPMPPESETFCRSNLGEEEFKKYGENNWYDWSRKNWGTKWNCCEASCNGISFNVLSYFFQTAWSPAIPIMKALAEKYKVKVKLVFIDEDIGSNCGKIAFNENGEITEDVYFSENGFDLIAEEYGEDYLYDCGYEKKDGEWQIIEE